MQGTRNTDLRRTLANARSCMEGWPQVLFGFVFGSTARAEARPDSDLDVAVFLDQATAKTSCGDFHVAFLTELLQCLGRNDVDLVILNQAPIVLRHRVLRDGRLVFSRNEARRVAFTVDTLQRYVDTAPLRKIAREYMRRSIQHGTYGRKVEYRTVVR